MIVLTRVRNDVNYNLMEGDKFRMSITDNTGCNVLIEEEIAGERTIDFIASYRFAEEDGTVLQFHLSGIFGSRHNLPKEIVEAVRFEDLTKEQQDRFRETCGIKIQDSQKKLVGILDTLRSALGL